MKPFHPQIKQKRIRLKGADYTKFRKAVHKRANGLCQTCGRNAPLMVGVGATSGYFDEYLCGHVSHERHGSNKEDTMDAVIWQCFPCHNTRNALQWSKSNGQR